MKLSNLWRRGADCTSAAAKTNSKGTKNQYKTPKKTKTRKNKNTMPNTKFFWHSCIWDLELKLFPGVQEIILFGCFWVLFFCFFGIGFVGIGFWGYYFVAIQVLMQSAPCSTSLTMSFMRTNTWLQKCSKCKPSCIWRDRK